MTDKATTAEAPPPERIWISSPNDEFKQRCWFPVQVDPRDIAYMPVSLHEREVKKLRWLASVVYLHYHNTTRELDPIQQKHWELAVKAGAPFSDPEENARALAALSRQRRG